MRGEDDVRVADQGVLGERLLAEDVERSPGDLARVERGLQVLLDEERAARDVQHAHAVLHLGEGLVVEPVLGLRSLGEADGDEVGLGVELVGGRCALHAELAEAFLGHVEVESEDPHPEAARPLRNELADPAEADHAERLLVELDAAEL